MKILFYAGYVYRKDLPEFQKNKTGFGMMVDGIADSVTKLGEEVHVLTHVFTKGHDVGYVIPKHSKLDFLLHMRLGGISAALKACRESGAAFKTKLRYIYYYMNTGFIKHYLKRFKPDVVHIHGLDVSDKFVIDLCREMKIPYVVTAHGLNQSSPLNTLYEKIVEKALFSQLEKEKVPVSVISTGIKRRLTEDYYALPSSDNVTVITNGTNVEIMPITRDVKAEMGIPEGAKIVLAVGSVQENKNQMQILRAYALLPEEIKDKTYVVLAGTLDASYPIREEAGRLGMLDRVRILGFVDHSELCNYYSASDTVVLASKDEGFGLSLVESFVYGKPAVFFNDIDPVADLAVEFATVLAEGRADSDLAKAIHRSLVTEWDPSRIMEYSKQFSLERMADKYRKLYQLAQPT